MATYGTATTSTSGYGSAAPNAAPNIASGTGKLKKPKPKPNRKRARKAPPAKPRPASTDPDLDAAVKLRYGSQERDLAEQLRQSSQNQTNISGWFQNYQSDLARRQIAQDAYYQGVQSANAQVSQQVGAQKLGPEASAQTQGDSQNAGAQRQALVAAFGEALRGQAASYHTYNTEQQGVGSAAQLGARLDEQKRAEALTRLRGELEGEKGAFAVQYKTDRESAARKRQLEDLAFGVDTAKATSQIQDRTADNKRADRVATQQAKDRKAQRVVSRKNTRDRIAAQKQRDAAKGTGKGLTPAQRRAARERANKAASKVETVAAKMGDYGKVPFTPKGGKPRKATRDEIFARLREEGASQDEIIVALAKRHGGAWDARTRAAAKRLGIKVPKLKPVQVGDVRKAPGSRGQLRPN